MSYDVNFLIDTGGADLASVGEHLNHTWNCAPMFSSALARDEGINWLNGKIGADVMDRLESAVAHIRHPANTKMYRDMNPENGWGNHDTATRFLESILAQCLRHPKATICVS